MQWFDKSDPSNIKKITWEEAKSLPQSSRELLKLPFDYSADKPLSSLDYNALKKISPKSLADEWINQSDLRAFESEILGDKDRTILGEGQEKWLSDQAVSYTHLRAHET